MDVIFFDTSALVNFSLQNSDSEVVFVSADEELISTAQERELETVNPEKEER